MDIQLEFEKIGGRFLTPASELQKGIHKIEAFVFDWDGVFNNGIKTSDQGSPFSEPDSMGVNMLRFSYYLLHGKLPKVAIISGANNQTAIGFGEREHLDSIMLKASNKADAIRSFCNKFQLKTEQCCFVFDDILDISATLLCKYSFNVRRSSSPMFQRYLEEEKVGDYITGSEGGAHAVREICELIIGLYGNYRETIQARIAFNNNYQQYLTNRSKVNPEKTIVSA